MIPNTTGIAAAVTTVPQAPAGPSGAPLTNAPAKSIAAVADAKRSSAGDAAPVEEAAQSRDPRSLQYHVADGHVVTEIVDENSKLVVVQIPNAEVLRIAKAIDRMQGFLLSQKA